MIFREKNRNRGGDWHPPVSSNTHDTNQQKMGFQLFWTPWTGRHKFHQASRLGSPTWRAKIWANGIIVHQPIDFPESYGVPFPLQNQPPFGGSHRDPCFRSLWMDESFSPSNQELQHCTFQLAGGLPLARATEKAVTLPETNIAMENPQFWWYLPGKIVIFMGYVSFREGKFVPEWSPLKALLNSYFLQGEPVVLGVGGCFWQKRCFEILNITSSNSR